MPFDLDAVIAEQKPATKRNQFTFTFDGEEYKLPNDVDLLALNAAATGDIATAVRRLLPPADFQRISASSKVLTREALTALLDAYYQHIVGLATGESAASTRSLKSTAGPSKRTSTTTTRRGRSKR